MKVIRPKENGGPKVPGIKYPIPADPYFQLECEHWTNRADAFLYSAWQPSPNKYFCETCGKWIERKKKEIIPLPDEPLF